MDGNNMYGYLSIVFVFGILVLFVILLAVIIKQVYRTKHLKIVSTADAAKEAEFRKFVESSFQLQQEMKEGQDKLAAEVNQLRTRVNAIEKLLREVE